MTTRTATRNPILRWLRQGTVFLILLALLLFFSLRSDRFLQSRNLVNILVQNAPVIVMTVGMTFTMLLGGIDLSVGSVAALAGAISAGLIVRNEMSVPLAMLARVLENQEYCSCPST